MDLRQQRVLQSQRRVQAWCAANPGLIPPPVRSPDAWTPITRQVDALNTIVSVATTAAAQQSVNGSQLTLEATDEPGLRKHLRQEMRSVTQVAQALKKTVPGISVLRMPSSKVQVEGLLKAADAFITQASTFETVLVEHALPSDFVKQLQDAAAALKASVDGRGAARAGRVSATEQLAVSLSLGTRFVQILDAALTKALRTNPAKLVEWRNAKRITMVGVTSTGILTTPTLVATAPVAATTIASPPATQPGSIPKPTAKAA
jgi:hypothetical protein